MRPRPDAAENGGYQLCGDFLDGAASMRPRPDAAENAEGEFGAPGRMGGLQ